MSSPFSTLHLIKATLLVKLPVLQPIRMCDKDRLRDMGFLASCDVMSVRVHVPCVFCVTHFGLCLPLSPSVHVCVRESQSIT